MIMSGEVIRSRKTDAQKRFFQVMIAPMKRGGIWGATV